MKAAVGACLDACLLNCAQHRPHVRLAACNPKLPCACVCHALQRQEKLAGRKGLHVLVFCSDSIYHLHAPPALRCTGRWAAGPAGARQIKPRSGYTVYDTGSAGVCPRRCRGKKTASLMKQPPTEPVHICNISAHKIAECRRTTCRTSLHCSRHCSRCAWGELPALERDEKERYHCIRVLSGSCTPAVHGHWRT